MILHQEKLFVGGVRYMIKRPIIIAGIAIALAASNVMAKEYFKWVDESGVTRYAEKPPAGVQAEKVTTYAGSSAPYNPNAATTDDTKKEEEHKAEVENRAKQLEKEEKEKCDKVSEQHKVLTERGRVRMKDKDGNERVLTEQEQAAKVVELEKYMKDMCSKKN
jgi:flagellar motility protein MotE (MotC chaperone)